jgi:hypothetical protein
MKPIFTINEGEFLVGTTSIADSGTNTTYGFPPKTVELTSSPARGQRKGRRPTGKVLAKFRYSQGIDAARSRYQLVYARPEKGQTE